MQVNGTEKTNIGYNRISVTRSPQAREGVEGSSQDDNVYVSPKHRRVTEKMALPS